MLESFSLLYSDNWYFPSTQYWSNFRTIFNKEPKVAHNVDSREYKKSLGALHFFFVTLLSDWLEIKFDPEYQPIRCNTQSNFQLSVESNTWLL